MPCKLHTDTLVCANNSTHACARILFVCTSFVIYLYITRAKKDGGEVRKIPIFIWKKNLLAWALMAILREVE